MSNVRIMQNSHLENTLNLIPDFGFFLKLKNIVFRPVK